MPSLQKRRKARDPVCIYVGRRLREVRTARGLSCAWVAHRIGMSTGAYRRLEQGWHRMHLDRLFSILAVLEAELDDVWPPEDWVHPDLPFGPCR